MRVQLPHNPRPACKLVTFLTWRELAAFIFAIGETKWDALVRCETFCQASNVLSEMPDSTVHAIRKAVPPDKLLEMSLWED